MKELCRKYRHALPLLIYGIVYLAWFSHLEKTVTRGYTVIHVALDDYIPFCEVFVVPYFLWFAYVAFVVIFSSKIRKIIIRPVCFCLRE